LGLLRLVPGYRWAAPAMVILGVAAAVAETLGVTLAVMFLFSILGKTDELAANAGLFSGLFQRFGNVLSANPMLIAQVLFALIVINALLIYTYQVLTAVATNRIAERMRDLVHELYVTVGYRYLQDCEQGALVQTLTNETRNVSEAIFSVARMVVNSCAIAVFGAGLLALSWQIGVTAALCALATFSILRLMARPIRRYSELTLAENQILAERMMVSLHGMRTLRAFAQEAYVLRLFSAASARVRKLAVRTERLKAMVGPFGEVASLGTLMLIAMIAGYVGIGVPTIVAAVFLLLRLQPHLRELDSHRLTVIEMSASLQIVGQTLAHEGKIWPTPGHIGFDGLRREIRFDNVSFTHDTRRGASVDAVSCVIRCGEITALSGPSGSGKTTIINLLLRLYEPASGKILIDGVDLLTLTRKSWLDRMAIAGQDVELIEGTVAQNLRLAKHDASIEDLREACATVEILDDILKIPEGFDARIGPGGLSFSGGQRQRLGLARALIRKPDFLILDEAMSALEPALEDRIKTRIAALMAGKTVLVVSHRANANAAAAAVIRIEAGRVDEAPLTSGSQLANA